MLYYIDPGTGSMLFTILVGALSAGVYAVRNLAVKLRFLATGGRQQADADRAAFAIFSDDKRYWNVFEPVCDELERRGIDARYLTASQDDPALSRDYAHVSCEFIGEGNAAFAKMNMLKADVVLSSTPGLDVYQWKRSRDVSFYAHVLHAVSDVTMYRMFGIDYYDAVPLTGEGQAGQVRELERLRGLPEKELPVVGLPYMDAMAARLEAAGPVPDHDTTVLLAPSWGKSGLLALYGAELIEALLATGYHVVVRPHPQSFASEADMMDALMVRFPASDAIEWNRDVDNFEVLRRADVMISDFSGVIFDYALVFDKPVIYTEPSFDADPYDACWLSEQPWTFEVLPSIGRQFTCADLADMKSVVDSCLGSAEFQAGRDRARDERWAYRGESAVRTVDYLVAKQAEVTASEETA